VGEEVIVGVGEEVCKVGWNGQGGGEMKGCVLIFGPFEVGSTCMSRSLSARGVRYCGLS
jgi:hypothetical protein